MQKLSKDRTGPEEKSRPEDMQCLSPIYPLACLVTFCKMSSTRVVPTMPTVRNFTSDGSCIKNLREIDRIASCPRASLGKFET